MSVPDPTVDEVVEVGPWRLVLRGTEVADLAHRGVPVLRALRFVTRDQDWRTAEDTLLARRVEVRPEVPSGRIRIEASSAYDGREVLQWTLEVVIDGGGVAVDATGTTTAPFRRNRIGLVLLHPPTLAGLPFTVRHPLGPPTSHAFPVWIAPHQPATDVSGYAWSVDGVDVEVGLTGDVFEMEDQRNWTDASYKTYSTPLSEPFPVDLAAGTTIRQSVTVQCVPSGVPVPSTRTGGATAADVRLAVLDGPSATTPLARTPSLQLLAASAPAAVRPPDDALLTGFPVLVEPELDHPDVHAVLASARRDAGDAGLDVRFVTDDPDALRAAVEEVLADGPVVRIGAYDPTTHVTTRALQRALRAVAAAHGVDVVAGTRAHFTELNRTVETFRDWDGPLSFSVTPQMHDRSRAQVTEALRMQRWVVTSASRLAAGRPLHVGPVTLRPRLNAVATTPRWVVTDENAEGGYGPQGVPDSTDPAQHTAAAGAWFAAAVEALSVPGVASITLAEAWGSRGLVTPGGMRSPAAEAILRLR